MKSYDAKDFIGMWVERTSNVNVDYCAWVQKINSEFLEIPSK
jgi:hypothetical protein